MSTQKQRREAARRHLERQVQRRAHREASRKKYTLAASIVGTLVVIGLIIGLVVGLGGNDKSTASAADSGGTSTASATDAPTDTPTGTPTSAAASTTYKPAQGAAVTFEGVKVVGATDLKGYPKVTSTAKAAPAKFAYRDLVVGTGKAASTASTVTVQYVGILYQGGTKPFDSSWARGTAASFNLTQVVSGFTEGIGGSADGKTTPPMKAGGRRLIIMPAAMGYGASSPSSAIPANSPLVFVVDLKSVDS